MGIPYQILISQRLCFWQIQSVMLWKIILGGAFGGRSYLSAVQLLLAWMDLGVESQVVTLCFCYKTCYTCNKTSSARWCFRLTMPMAYKKLYICMHIIWLAVTEVFFVVFMFTWQSEEIVWQVKLCSLSEVSEICKQLVEAFEGGEG